MDRAFRKTTLSKANEIRDWRIYPNFALLFIAQDKVLYQGNSQLEIPTIKEKAGQVTMRAKG